MIQPYHPQQSLTIQVGSSPCSSSSSKYSLFIRSSWNYSPGGYLSFFIKLLLPNFLYSFLRTTEKKDFIIIIISIIKIRAPQFNFTFIFCDDGERCEHWAPCHFSYSQMGNVCASALPERETKKELSRITHFSCGSHFGWWYDDGTRCIVIDHDGFPALL